MYSSASSRSHYVAVVTLLDQLDPKEYNWERFSVILEGRRSLPSGELGVLFDMPKSSIEFSGIVSKFSMDRTRAGSLWVNSQTFANLARRILEFLHDKWVCNPYTLALIQILDLDSRCFTDILYVHTKIPYEFQSPTYYGVGKLAFNLLPILLSRIKALGGSQVHEVTAFLRSHPPFYLIKNDPLELEKVKATQAIEEFLKVRF
jgi:hypothetical protein